MQNTKIGTFEAISFLLIIMINHLLSNIPKYIVTDITSSSILNAIFISIVGLFLAWLIGKLLSKFTPFDILDISKWLGGNVLRFIVGFLFLAYFIFFTAMLLKNLANCLSIIYFPTTKQLAITAIFLIAAIYISNLKYNSVFRANLFIMPILLLSILFLFVGNLRNYSYSSIFPVLGNGLYPTFVLGLGNLFVFQGFAYFFFLPALLKEPSNIKKVSLIAMILSGICLVLSVATILLLFNAYTDTDELLPLFSAVRFIEFGTFFQRLESIFVFIWIITFLSYLCTNFKISTSILCKITGVPNNKIYPLVIAAIIFVLTFIPKNYIVSTFFTGPVYKFTFFTLIFGIGFPVVIAAYIKKKLTR